MGLVARFSAAAEVNIRDGSSTGQILDVIGSAGAGHEQSYAEGVQCAGQLYVELVSGTMPTGSVRWR